MNQKNHIIKGSIWSAKNHSVIGNFYHFLLERKLISWQYQAT